MYIYTERGDRMGEEIGRRGSYIMAEKERGTRREERGERNEERGTRMEEYRGDRRGEKRENYIYIYIYTET